MNDLREKCCHYFKMLQQTSYDHNHPIKVLLNQYDKEHPGLNAFELKAIQYEMISENIDVVVWEETPFYFVNDISRCPGFHSSSVSNWLLERNYHIYEDADPETWRKFQKQQKLKLFLCCGPYCDNVHYTVSVGNLVKYGMKKYYEDAELAKACATKEELDFLTCAQRGLLAAKRICQRYAEKACEKLKETTNPNHRKNLELLIQSANHAPWEAPSTFFEGLNACWFARNVLGAMEGIGNCTLGRVDYLLYDLYQEDIKKGRLTKEQAYHLIKQFVLLGDNQYDKDKTVESDNDSELEMGLGLGGCDKEGTPVYNELTSMFLRAHREMNCIYPKIHARFASDSPTEYLEELTQDIVSGRSVIGLSCDDGIIPGLIHDGRRLEDARCYETAGCWDNMVPNKEAMSCANYIYSLTVLEQAVYGPEPEYLDAGFQCTPLEEATSFEEVYQILFTNLKQLIRWRCKAIGTYGKLASKVNPLCLTSALRDGSIQSKKDYTQGGSVYNKNNYAIVGFANYVDAMLVIKKLCFDEKIISLKEFLNVVRANWENNEDLLHQVRKCPHFGDNNSESNNLSHRLHLDLCHVTEGIENEHGGNFFLNYYVYREFFRETEALRATPDGRKTGELYAQGIGPSKYHCADSLTDILQSVSQLDPKLYGTSSLNLQLPFGKTSKEQLAMLLKIIAKMKIKHLQINCTSPQILREAQKNPQKYQDLIVRVTGFSAKFVALSPNFQEEIIQRHILEERRTH